MRLTRPLERTLNDQVRKEFNAYYLYLAMSAWFTARHLDGFAKWMRLQASEEQGHAMRLFDYILDRGGQVRLQAVEEPQAAWKTPLAVFEAAAAHEALVSASIRALHQQAAKERDSATQVMLQWFLSEQVEEEKTSTAIVARIRMVGDSPSGLLMLDRQLGERGGQ